MMALSRRRRPKSHVERPFPAGTPVGAPGAGLDQRPKMMEVAPPTGHGADIANTGLSGRCMPAAADDRCPDAARGRRATAVAISRAMNEAPALSPQDADVIRRASYRICFRWDMRAHRLSVGTVSRMVPGGRAIAVAVRRVGTRKLCAKGEIKSPTMPPPPVRGRAS